MKTSLLSFLIFSFFVFNSCQNSIEKISLIEKIQKEKLHTLQLKFEASLRGLCVVDSKVVWVSGSKGTYAKTIDAGKNWIEGKISNDTLSDFRDIHAFDQDKAVAMSVGCPGRIYHTNNGGESWELKYENSNEYVFMNSIDFINDTIGFVCGDPIDGYFFVLKTIDGGQTWNRIDKSQLPEPFEGEAQFSASGTCITHNKAEQIVFVTGGSVSRAIGSSDNGETWQAVETPITSGGSCMGIYSIDFLNENIGVVAGGCWEKTDFSEKIFAITNDGGRSWALTASMPNGFKSCVQFFPQSGGLIVCGRSGVHLSINNGNDWIPTAIEPFYAVDISANEKIIVFTGNNGRIAWMSVN